MQSRQFFPALILLVLMSSGPDSIAATSESVSEDGRSQAPAMRGKSTGKLDPSLHALTNTNDWVEVFIVLEPGDTETQRAQSNAEVQSIKAARRDQIKALKMRIRELDGRTQSSQSRDESAEKDDLETRTRSANNGQLSKADKAELKNVRKQLDRHYDEIRTSIGKATERDVSQARSGVTAVIAQLGGTVTAGNLPTGIAARVPAGALAELAEHPQIRQVVLDAKPDYELDVSVPSTEYSSWWTNNYDGGAFDFGLVDTGLQQNHPAFSGVTAFFTNSGETTDSDSTLGHGTHVAGIVASADTTYKGGAYGLDAIIWGYSGFQSVTMANMHWQVSDAGQSPEVLNHSLGYGATQGTTYSPNDSFYDAFVENYDVLVTKSAGNSGWHDSQTTITFPGTAYNIIAVANMDDQNTSDRSDDVRRYDSSVGPVTDGRRKPDITAPGTYILSTNSGWEDGSDFVSKSGTSMAAPHVAAAVILLEQAGNYIPMAQKAVMINAADAWNSNNTSTTSDDGPVPGSHWDKSYGWGYLDMNETFIHRHDYFIGSVTGRNETSTNDDYKLYKGQMFADEKATLVWQKRAGQYVAGAPATDQYALGDLNIRLYSEADGASIDSDLGALDNVHQVAANATIDAVIKVYAWDTVLEGATSEPYALATEENFTEVDPPSFTHTYSAPTWVGPNQTFNVDVGVSNVGGVAALNTQVTLSDVSTLSGGTTQNYGSIDDAAGETSNSFALTTSGAVAGSLAVPLNVSSSSYAEVYTLAATLNLQVETTPAVGNCTFASGYVNSQTVSVPWSAVDTQTGVKNNFLYVKGDGDSAFSYANISSSGDAGTMLHPVSADGLWQYAIRSEDIGNNVEAVPVAADCTVFVDSVVPAVTMNTPSWVVSSAIPISYAVTDSAPSSGMSYIDFWYRKLPGGTWTYSSVEYTATSGVISFNPPGGNGYYEFFARSADNAGNANIQAFPTQGESTTQWATVPDYDEDTIPDNIDPDVDNDLLPDDWELDNGFDPYDVADGNLDSDGDGRSNGEEFVDEGDWSTPDTGDVTGDGVVNLSDGLLVSRHLIGLAPLDAAALSRGDFDRNGAVDIGDQLLLQKLLLAGD
tara:strand:- start:1826 stop:5113 length:3288 start_codon:yes stop_codon:yes gene_type:complete